MSWTIDGQGFPVEVSDRGLRLIRSPTLFADGGRVEVLNPLLDTGLTGADVIGPWEQLKGILDQDDVAPTQLRSWAGSFDTCRAEATLYLEGMGSRPVVVHGLAGETNWTLGLGCIRRFDLLLRAGRPRGSIAVGARW